MTRDEAKQACKANLEGYLQGRGINTRKPFKCLNPEHQDRSPSMSYDPRRNNCHCFSCGANADIFTVIQWEYGLPSIGDAFKVAYDIFGLDVDGVNTDGMEYQKVEPKEAPKERKETVRADAYTCHKVYEAMKEACGLSQGDIKYLHEARGLSMDRIGKDYFRISSDNRSRKRMVSEVKRLTGVADDVLKTVPGFYAWRSSGQVDCCMNDGIGILIRDENGMATAVQIRRDTLGKKNMRYAWFSSQFAANRPEKYDGGCTPGSPKDVLIPDGPKSSLCITEGRFKSEVLAQSRNISISVQGILNWKGIDGHIDAIREKHELKNIFLMFDSDVMGNPQLIQNLWPLVKMLGSKYPDIPVYCGVWRKTYGKGIDDCILAGNVDKVYYVRAREFLWACQDTLSLMLEGRGVRSLLEIEDEAERKEICAKLQEANEERIVAPLEEAESLKAA